MYKATTPAPYALILIDLVERLGGERSLLLQGTSLEGGGLAKLGARIEDAEFIQLMTNALEITGDPAFGLKFGVQINLSAHAVLGQAFLSCRNLQEVIDVWLKFHHLTSPNLKFSFEVRGNTAALTAPSGPWQDQVKFGNEILYGGMLNTLRSLLGMPELQLSFEIPYREPSYGATYREILGPNVRFDRPVNRVSFPRVLLDAPLPASNPALRELYEQECARLLADMKAEASVSQQTLGLLRKLEGRYPQMPEIAQMLNYSPRTYRRRLADEDTSYQALLDQIRAEHATYLLQESRMPLSTIAYMVGFNDASNFRRAYRKWTGHAPGEARNVH